MSNAAMIIVPTDISEKIREIETAYARYLKEFRIPDTIKSLLTTQLARTAPQRSQWPTRCSATE